MVFKSGDTGKCPHCGMPNRFEGSKMMFQNSSGSMFGNVYFSVGTENNNSKELVSCKCTNCGKLILTLDNRMIYPLGSARGTAPQEVPTDITNDFNEACLVESLSKKASAALARRCLQNMLHDQGIKDKDLSKEIDQAMTKLPSHLSDAIDAIRNIGNFSAHPMKYQNTGDIVDVEDGETERILDTLEDLFDFYYVQPAKTQAKKAALNAKLTAAGKPPMK